MVYAVRIRKLGDERDWVLTPGREIARYRTLNEACSACQVLNDLARGSVVFQVVRPSLKQSFRNRVWTLIGDIGVALYRCYRG
jgi:hypothetical protein